LPGVAVVVVLIPLVSQVVVAVLVGLFTILPILLYPVHRMILLLALVVLKEQMVLRVAV
jgi:hypothetical protein